MNQFLSISSSGDLAVWYSSILNIVPLKTIEQGVYRNRNGQIDTWKHEHSTSNKVLIYCEYLPKETKAKLVQHLRAETEKLLGDTSELEGLFNAEQGSELDVWYAIEQLQMAAEEASEMTDLDWFISQKLWSPAQCGDLKKACGWLRILSQKDWYLRFGLRGQTRANAFAAKLINAQKLYGFKITNGRVLERKVKEWSQMALRSLVSEKFGTVNAVKKIAVQTAQKNLELTKLEIRDLAIKRMIYLYGDGKVKMSIHQVTEVYNQEARERSYPTYTKQRVGQILDAHEWAYLASRDGKVVAKDKRESVIKRKRPTTANQLWSIDGTTIQLYARDEQGKVTKAGYWVMVVDAGTDAILGYAFGQTETSDLILKALRMAVNRNMCLPEFVQYDGGKANLSSEVQTLIKDMDTKGLRAQPYNGKSKYVERIIGKIEQGFMRLMPNFVGGNITTRRQDSKANSDALKQMLKDGEFREIKDVLQDMRLIIETYNYSPVARLGMGPMRAYLRPNETERKANELMVVALFWLKKANTYLFRTEGLTMEIRGDKRLYVVESETRGIESLAFRDMYLGKRLVVRYNPDDLSRIHLYDGKDIHIGVAVEKYEFSAIPTEGDMGVLKEAWKIRDSGTQRGIELQKQRHAEQLAFGNEESSFALVHKGPMNEALEVMEEEGNFGVRQRTRLQQTETVGVMYDPSCESGKVISFEE